MGKVKLLIADSDPKEINIIKAHAVLEDFTLDDAADGISAIKLFRRNEYNIILCDTLLPELDGKNVCRQIRKVSDTPIIMLSNDGNEQEKLEFYEIGADDFITRPILPKELIARVKVLLHRSGKSNELCQRRIVYGGLCIDLVSRMVYVDGSPISLTPREYSLLLFLAQNPHKAFSRDTLLTRVWGQDYLGVDRTVDTHIRTLRESIKPYQDYIATLWGYGYLFKGE